MKSKRFNLLIKFIIAKQMIIVLIWKFLRYTYLNKQICNDWKTPWYRKSFLFEITEVGNQTDPETGNGRDHIRIRNQYIQKVHNSDTPQWQTHPKNPFMNSWQQYIIIWRKEYYICSKWEKKRSIKPFYIINRSRIIKKKNKFINRFNHNVRNCKRMSTLIYQEVIYWWIWERMYRLLNIQNTKSVS